MAVPITTAPDIIQGITLTTVTTALGIIPGITATGMAATMVTAATTVPAVTTAMVVSTPLMAASLATVLFPITKALGRA